MNVVSTRIRSSLRLTTTRNATSISKQQVRACELGMFEDECSTLDMTSSTMAVDGSPLRLKIERVCCKMLLVNVKSLQRGDVKSAR